MTGGGSADLAFALESSFLGSLQGAPDYYAFGRDPTVQEVSIDNVLQRMHEPDSVWSVESVTDNFEGAFGVEAVVNANVFPTVEDIVFNGTDAGGDKAIVAGRPTTATIYSGIDYLDGTVERALEGFAPVTWEIQYQEDDRVRYTLTGMYASEDTNTSITPSSVTQAADGGHSAPEDFDLSIDTSSVSKLQSATLTIDGISRFQRDGNPTPADVVVGQPVATLDMTAIFSGPSRLERALGSAGATTTEDRISGVAATIDIDNDASDVSDYNLDTVKPATYDWQDLIAGDADLMETVQFNVDGEQAVTVA